MVNRYQPCAGFQFELQDHHCHEEFYALIVAANCIDSEVPPTGIISNEDKTLVEPVINEFMATLLQLFYKGRTLYTEVIADRDQERDLLAWAKSAVDATATQTTATTTTKVNLSSPELGDLIKSKVLEETKKFKTTISRLEKQVKDHSAASRKGGQNQKNNKQTAKNNANRKSSAKGQKQGQKAANAANDSTNAKKKQRNRRRRPKKKES